MEMSAFTRRGMLIWSAGSLVLAGSGVVINAVGKDAGLPNGDPYSPWTLWNAKEIRGTPVALVAAAILAANPHDTQPWLFRTAEDRIEVFADLGRNLGAMDSFVREMHLGLGCAVENAVLAAPPNGFSARVEVVPGSVAALSARRGFVRAATIHLEAVDGQFRDPLTASIPHRHTNRYAYDRSRGVAAGWQASANATARDAGVRLFLFSEGRLREAFDAAIIDATQAIVADSPMIADSDRWLRRSRAEIEAHRDGPTLEAAGLSPITLALAKLLPLPREMEHRGWLSQTREQVATAPLLGLIAVRDRYDRQTALVAGRVWQRLHLAATARGLAMQPLNQPIEMADRERAVGRGTAWHRRLAMLTGNEWQATFAFRAGYASAAAPASPRRRLSDVLRTAG